MTKKQDYRIVSVQEEATTSVRPYDNADIETATNQVVDDPNEVAQPTTGNVYADHRYDIRRVAVKHNCDMNTATCIWEHEYFKGKHSPEISAQRKRWMEFMRHITLNTKYTLADMF